MAGTTIEVRANGTGEDLADILAAQHNKLQTDLETIRSAVNTANGGTTGLPIGALTASQIRFLVG